MVQSYHLKQQLRSNILKAKKMLQLENQEGRILQHRRRKGMIFSSKWGT